MPIVEDNNIAAAKVAFDWMDELGFWLRIDLGIRSLVVLELGLWVESKSLEPKKLVERMVEAIDEGLKVEIDE